MKVKQNRLLALALLLMLCVVFTSTTNAAGVTSSDQNISNTTIKSAIASSAADELGNFDAKADERMRRVVKILRTTDKAQVNQFVPVALEMKNVNPFAVVRFIRKVVEVEEGNWWTFVSAEGNSGLVLVNVPLWQVEPIKELVALLDRPGMTSASGTTRIYLPLNHRNPNDAGFLDTIAGLLTHNGQVIPDIATGSIFIEDAPSGIHAVKSFLSEIDAPTGATFVQSKIYELDLVNDGTLGLDFHAWKNGPGRNLFNFQAFKEFAKVGTGNDALIIDPGGNVQAQPNRRLTSHGYNGSFFYELPSAYFDFLVSKGRARVLTAPRVVVGNNKTAFFRTGEQILFYKVQNGPAPTAGVRPAGLVIDPLGSDVRFPDNRSLVGSLTPRSQSAVTGVDSDRQLVIGTANAGVEVAVFARMMENVVDVNIDISVVSHLGFDGNGTPLLSTRRINESFFTKYGEEHILGGISRTRSIQNTRKVPFLGSIPVLGYLFGGETTLAKKTELAAMVVVDEVFGANNVGPADQSVFDQVQTPGMGGIDLPETLVNFDSVLMNSTR